MIALMSTSLKVVSIAVVFFASTSRREIVFRRLLIFSRRSWRLNRSLPGVRPGWASASSTSFFKIFPPVPDGTMEPASIFLSEMMAAATGVARILLGIVVTGACTEGATGAVAAVFVAPVFDAGVAGAAPETVALPAGRAAVS